MDASGLAITIATMAIVLIVVVIVIANLTTNLSAGLTGAGLAAYNNVTYYTWVGLQLVAIGLIIVAGMGLIYLMLGGRR